MCRYTKMKKFVRRYRAGDLGYCLHRLRKFNNRREEALRTVSMVIRDCESCVVKEPIGEELASQILTLKNEILNEGLVGYPELANFVFECGGSEHRREMAEDMVKDFASFLKGESPNLITLDECCCATNDFTGEHFTAREELLEWLKELNEDRGPLDVELADGYSILKDDVRDVDCPGWILSQVAIVRDGSEPRKTLFVALIGEDLSDAVIKTICLSTDNRLWNLDFESPKFKAREPSDIGETREPVSAVEQEQQDNIHSMDMGRPNRANDLARAMEAWQQNKTERNFSVALWGVGVDAVFGKTVFVPAAFSAGGFLGATGPVDEKGCSFYSAHIDPADEQESNDKGCIEIPLAKLMRMALADARAAGIEFSLGDIGLKVNRCQIENLVKKIGMAIEEDEDDE